MDLTRRQLIASLASLAAAQQISPTFASQKQSGGGGNKDNDRDHKDLADAWSNPGFIRLNTLSTVIQISNLILITAFALYFIRFLSLRHNLTRHNENRLSIPKSVPLFGSLFEETYSADDFTTDKRLGLAYTYDNSLILDLVPNRPQIGEDNHPELNLDQTITELDNAFPSIGQELSLKIGQKSFSSDRIDLLNTDFSYRMPSTELKALSGEKHPLTFMSDIPVLSTLFKNPVGEVYGGRSLQILVKPSIVYNEE